MLDAAARKHDVVIGFSEFSKEALDEEYFGALRERQGITVLEQEVCGQRQAYPGLAWLGRTWLDFLPSLSLTFLAAGELRARARDHLPRRITLPSRLLPFGRQIVRPLLMALERRLPTDPFTDAVLARVAPDLLVVGNYAEFNSPQAELVKSARAAGIPSICTVNSWDNLTNKGTLHPMPDRVLVWNRHQKREAMRLHGIPSNRIEVTGAQALEHWFDRRPTLDRAAFLDRAGLAAEDRYILYVGSSPSIIEFHTEKWLVSDLARRMKGFKDPAGRPTRLMVRPHFQASAAWDDEVSFDPARVTIFPGQRANPLAGQRIEDFFHSMYYADAVVGVNTTAMIDALILGRPVLTVCKWTHRRGQWGTVHFRYLLRGGAVRAHYSMKALIARLAGIAGGPFPEHRVGPFVDDFVRAGQDNSTEAFVAALERPLPAAPARPCAAPPAWFGPLERRARDLRDSVHARRLTRKVAAPSAVGTLVWKVLTGVKKRLASK